MPPDEQSDPEIAQPGNQAAIRGIILALRYLSREAEGAGLKELARTLEEAELKCDRGAGKADGLAELPSPSMKANQDGHNAPPRTLVFSRDREPRKRRGQTAPAS